MAKKIKVKPGKAQSNSAPLCRGDGRTGRNPKGFDETWNLHCRGLRFQHVLA